MRHDALTAEPTFGFLSSLESPDFGYFGGYLIVSLLGRPVEFHCTSPVKPSRAQEILYGPTLQPYLLGEQIAGALLLAAKLMPRLIITDQPAILSARSRAKAPITLLLPRTEGSIELQPAVRTQQEEVASNELESALTTIDGHFTVGQYELQMPSGFESEWHVVRDASALLSQRLDLCEPFGRIHEAIREAQRIGARSAESHDQAA